MIFKEAYSRFFFSLFTCTNSHFMQIETDFTNHRKCDYDLSRKLIFALFMVKISRKYNKIQIVGFAWSTHQSPKMDFPCIRYFRRQQQSKLNRERNTKHNGQNIQLIPIHHSDCHNFPTKKIWFSPFASIRDFEGIMTLTEQFFSCSNVPPINE